MATNSENQEIEFKIMIFNVKFFSNDRDPSPEIYKDILIKANERRAAVDVSGDRSATIRLQFERDNVLYGNILTYLRIGDYYDRTNQEMVENPLEGDDLYPYPKETKYVFIPETHRFCVIENGKVPETHVYKYIFDVFNRYLEENEEVKIYVEQDVNGFEEIFNARSISQLKIDISYTNNDLTEDFEEFLDNDLRDGQVREFKVDSKGEILLDGTKVLKGTLKLAQSNGYAEANIVDVEGSKKKVSTKEYPLRPKIKGVIDREYLTIKQWIIDRFPRNN